MSRRPTPPALRFWRLVDKTGECWLWAGALFKNGYGRFRLDGEHTHALTHRVAWELEYGPIPLGVQVLHRCDVRPCVRPDHLFLGTQADNIADMWRKGRQRVVNPRGEASGVSRLTEEAVRTIRAEYRPRIVSLSHLARRFGVTKRAVRLVVLRETWGWLE